MKEKFEVKSGDRMRLQWHKGTFPILGMCMKLKVMLTGSLFENMLIYMLTGCSLFQSILICM